MYAPRLSKCIKDVDSRCTTGQLHNGVDHKVSDREAAIDEHGEGNRGIHICTAEAANEEDDKRKGQTDDQGIAGSEDADQKQKGAEELRKIGSKSDHLFLP